MNYPDRNEPRRSRPSRDQRARPLQSDFSFLSSAEEGESASILPVFSPVRTGRKPVSATGNTSGSAKTDLRKRRKEERNTMRVNVQGVTRGGRSLIGTAVAAVLVLTGLAGFAAAQQIRPDLEMGDQDIQMEPLCSGPVAVDVPPGPASRRPSRSGTIGPADQSGHGAPPVAGPPLGYRLGPGERRAGGRASSTGPRPSGCRTSISAPPIRITTAPTNGATAKWTSPASAPCMPVAERRWISA